MKTQTVDPANDPSLFEWEVEDVPDEDVYESMAMRKVSPDVLIDPDDREMYRQYLKTNGYTS